MAWTQADIDALKGAIAKGALRLKLDGEEVWYRSIAEMQAVLRMMEAEVNGRPSTGFGVIYPVTRRGLSSC